ncbi:phosphoadenylyl-sulfate reductase [Cytophaga hutchinsonii]|uniref:Adenosine 5'-phosphosulfate reductase n=1 Tax=Cytophaga hutchinsonii (strain ATCC 33406 / DSM 1761 / CIP 103989 / NBRC 15051 / NCIMB 9469 / D465) TaxID=269798 RepID=A0A6N4SPG7_CYTH3|nr:phosphoadenylyl-sulfate reductase [Cytophaga hutchinsonii]ABG58234.1 phosphoadenylylsulfate reductase (thioredoxin) [Cytophaga hutchinsonii ATCC 33406]SFX54410.1 phosphoadenylylsulfate reductase (thioredoxin) [Cytophaga hutchinsonii ATCC 33406]
MNKEEIHLKLTEYQEKGLKLFTTSSFQTHSIVLLHILSEFDPSIPVYFINTGYHFPETVLYRDQIADLFNLKNIKVVSSATPRNMQKDAEGRLLFTSDPDYCCYLNKVQPLDAVLPDYDIWINGVRADQSAVRKSFSVEQPAPHDTIRFHPMLDWDVRMIEKYIKEHKIPRHPLEEKGYLSIGCEPCTRKFDLETYNRQGRWFGLNKTECGLNTELVSKK